MPWFIGVILLWGLQIHGLLCPSFAHLPSPPSCSHSYGNSPRQENRKQSCSEQAPWLRSPCCRSSTAWFLKQESPSSGVSLWCHGYRPYPFSWTFSCWVLWMVPPMLDSDSFPLWQCLCMCSTVFMLALMQKERALSVWRMGKSTWNQHKNARTIVWKCRRFTLVNLFYWPSFFVGFDGYLAKRAKREKEKWRRIRGIEYSAFLQEWQIV